MSDSRVTPQALEAAAKAMHAYEEPEARWEPWRASYLDLAEKALAAAAPLLCQPLQDEIDRLRGEHRDLTRRLEFGDGITEPQADNDTIVAWVEQESRDAAEWRESQRWRADCYQAGHPDDEDCAVHDPSLRLERAEADVDRLRAVLASVEAALLHGGQTAAIRAQQALLALAASPVGTGNPTQPRADD